MFTSKQLRGLHQCSKLTGSCVTGAQRTDQDQGADSPQQEQRLLREAELGQVRALSCLLHTDDSVAFRLFLLQIIRQLRWSHLGGRFRGAEYEIIPL